MRWVNMVSYSLRGMVFLVQLVKDNFLCVPVVICNTLIFIGFHVSKSKMKPLITSKWNTRVSCCFKEYGQLSTSVDCWWENGDVKARGAKACETPLGSTRGRKTPGKTHYRAEPCSCDVSTPFCVKTISMHLKLSKYSEHPNIKVVCLCFYLHMLDHYLNF